MTYGYCYPEVKNIFHEYLCEKENILENILGYCSRAQVLSIYAKNQSSKISCYSPFKRLVQRALKKAAKVESLQTGFWVMCPEKVSEASKSSNKKSNFFISYLSQLASCPAKTKIFSQIFWGVAQGPLCIWFMKKAKARKSHATLPLNN